MLSRNFCRITRRNRFPCDVPIKTNYINQNVNDKSENDKSEK